MIISFFVDFKVKVFDRVFDLNGKTAPDVAPAPRTEPWYGKGQGPTKAVQV